jgi:hypothetical protein
MELSVSYECDWGLGWIAAEPAFMQRASHALAHGGGLWLVDPVDGEGLDERLARRGEVRGVLQLLDRHPRDCAALARRHGVPLLTTPFARVPGAPFEPVAVVRRRRWDETALWWPDPGALVVAEALGTAPHYLAGRAARRPPAAAADSPAPPRGVRGAAPAARPRPAARRPGRRAASPASRRAQPPRAAAVGRGAGASAPARVTAASRDRPQPSVEELEPYSREALEVAIEGDEPPPVLDCEGREVRVRGEVARGPGLAQQPPQDRQVSPGRLHDHRGRRTRPRLDGREGLIGRERRREQPGSGSPGRA